MSLCEKTKNWTLLRTPPRSKNVFRCSVAVVGLPANQLRARDPVAREGVGKSSLCSRFTRGHQDDYIAFGEDHNSVLSFTDFQEPAVNGDHFLYFGTTSRTAPSSGDEVRFDVVEHTELVNDFDYSPFNSSSGRLLSYGERAVQPRLRSLSKAVYTCRQDVEQRPENETDGKRPCDARSGLDIRMDALLLVLDLSRSVVDIGAQVGVLRKIAAHATTANLPCCLVLTKCDKITDKDIVAARPEILSRKYGKLIQPKRPLATFCVSSREGVGVDYPFLFLAQSLRHNKALRKQYLVPRRLNYQLLSKLKGSDVLCRYRKLSTLFKKLVTTSETRWEDVRPDEHYEIQGLSAIEGEQASRQEFARHVLDIEIKQLALESFLNDIDGDLDCEWVNSDLIDRLESYADSHPDVARFRDSILNEDLWTQLDTERRLLIPGVEMQTSLKPADRRSKAMAFACVYGVEDEERVPLLDP